MSDLADHDFVSLTTFRRTGKPVPTAMWFARTGDHVVFSTPAGAGKLKRLAHTSDVVLQPCSRRGQVVAGTVPVSGTARIVTDPAERERVEGALAGRYGWQWRVALLTERLVTAARRRPRHPRVAIVVDLLET